MLGNQGQIIAAHGRQYLVETSPETSHETNPQANPETPHQTCRLCFPRSKKSELACGDQVIITPIGKDQGVIEKILPRRSLLYRSNALRQKLIAANVTQILIVVATEPTFSEDLITRCLVAAESQNIRPLIVLNKCDLENQRPDAQQKLAIYRQLGYPYLETSRDTAKNLLPHLQGHTSVLVGQSGMGKSSLINQLIPQALAKTREISTHLDSGKHTTTHAQLYHLDKNTQLIDSPGLQEFSLHHLNSTQINQSFPELHPLLGQCRFRNCQHKQEPGCALQSALATGQINPQRFACYQTLQSACLGKP